MLTLISMMFVLDIESSESFLYLTIVLDMIFEIAGIAVILWVVMQ